MGERLDAIRSKLTRPGWRVPCDCRDVQAHGAQRCHNSAKVEKEYETLRAFEIIPGALCRLCERNHRNV
jgi:hypothetical protein